MFFSSIKEINRLISKRISNIYLKLTIKKNWHSQSFDFFVSGSGFGELQLTQISVNFKTSCYKLKTRGLGEKFILFLFYYGFSIVLILKGIMTF